MCMFVFMLLLYGGCAQAGDKEHTQTQYMCDSVDDVTHHVSHVQHYLMQCPPTPYRDHARVLWHRYMRIHKQEVYNIFVSAMGCNSTAFFDRELCRIRRSIYMHRLAASLAAETDIPQYGSDIAPVISKHNGGNNTVSITQLSQSYVHIAYNLTRMLAQVDRMRYWLQYDVPRHTHTHNHDLIERYRLWAYDCVQRAQAALRSIHTCAAQENDQLNGYIIALHRLTSWDLNTLSSLHNQSVSSCNTVIQLARISHSAPEFVPITCVRDDTHD